MPKTYGVKETLTNPKSTAKEGSQPKENHRSDETDIRKQLVMTPKENEPQTLDSAQEAQLEPNDMSL